MRNQMTLTRLIVREMQRSKVNTLLCLVVVTLATGVFVAMTDINMASVDSTRVMMKNMGFNLLVTPQGVDPARYQALDFQDVDMPEEYVSKLSNNAVILAQHFVGKYQKTIELDGHTVVLTGVLAEVPRTGTEKTPMPTAYTVSRGQVFLGAAVARAMGKTAGDKVMLLGRPFDVGRVLDEIGVMPEDIRVYAHLHDVQELLGRPGRINAIDALACQCPAAAKDIVGLIRKSIQDVLPDVNAQPYQSILLARHEQRVLMHRLEMAALAIVILGSASALWGLTYQNVANRRHEIGVLRALGVADRKIYGVFLGKILAYGVTGAVLGCWLGRITSSWLSVTASPVVAPMNMLACVVIVTPLACIVFGLPPIVSRLMQEPSDVLGEGTT